MLDDRWLNRMCGFVVGAVVMLFILVMLTAGCTAMHTPIAENGNAQDADQTVLNVQDMPNVDWDNVDVAGKDD